MRFSAARSAMRMRVRTVALPIWGTMKQLGEGHERVVRWHRLRIGDIEPGRGDGPVGQGLDQRARVDHLAAGGVHQGGGGSHSAQRRPIDQPVGTGIEAGQHHDMVGLRQEGLEGTELHTEPRLGGAVTGPLAVQHPHPETGGAAGDRPADPAQPHDAERGNHAGPGLRGRPGPTPPSGPPRHPPSPP